MPDTTATKVSQVTTCIYQVRTTYQTPIVLRTAEYRIPPEHRVKPSPLDITSRVNQYRYSATPLIIRIDGTVGGTCSAYTLLSHFHSKVSWSYRNVSISMNQFTYTDSWVQAMRLKIQDDKVSFAETIGEWRDGVRLLGSCLSTVKRAFSLARSLLKKRTRRRALTRWFRGQFGKNPDTPLELIDAVSLDLAIKFGIKPNLNLLWDTLEALGHVGARKRRLQVSLSEKKSSKIPGTRSGSLDWSGERKTRCVCYVTYDLEASAFTSGNLAESLWAGVPASFVLDWFYDVGSYLSSFNAMKGVSSCSGFVSYKTITTGTDTRVTNVGESVSEPGKISWTSKSRTRLTTLPYSDLPTFKLPDSDLWGRLFTLTEMAASMRSGHR